MAQLKQRIPSVIFILITTIAETIRALVMVFRSRSALAAENLFLASSSPSPRTAEATETANGCSPFFALPVVSFV